jgi:predicted dehydrogenase
MVSPSSETIYTNKFILSELLGEVKSVIAKMDTFTHDIETEDTGMLIIRFKNGALGNVVYTTCTYNQNIEGSIGVFGTKGTVKIGGSYLNQLERWIVKGCPRPKLKEEITANNYGTYKGSASSHDKVIQNMVDIILKKKEDYTSGEEGIKTVAIIEAAQKSAQTGKEIAIG